MAGHGASKTRVDALMPGHPRLQGCARRRDQLDLFADEFRGRLAERERPKERGGIGHAIDPALESPDRDTELIELRLVLLVAVRDIDERLVACDAEYHIVVPGLPVFERLPDEVSAGDRVERDRLHTET